MTVTGLCALCQPQLAASTHLSLADNSAPAPCHQGEGDDSGESGGVLDLLCHSRNPQIVLPSFLFSLCSHCKRFLSRESVVPAHSLALNQQAIFQLKHAVHLGREI